MIKRKHTRQINVKGILIGGGAPVVIQSMTNRLTTDIDATLEQIEALSFAGCEIVRVAVPDRKSAKAFEKIRKQTEVPLVADIHFQYRLAIAAIEAGADKVRINPGNIGSEIRVKAIVDAAKHAGIPIRIGVNSGSLEKGIIKKFGGPTPNALVESAMGYIRMMERFSFDDIVISIKATDIMTTCNACRLIAKECNYPMHIGITESGTVRSGSVKSSVGIGILLSHGIGDTIRVSLSGDPIKEVYVAKEILKSLGLMPGPIIISCPTCSRTQIDVATFAERVENRVSGISAPLKIAVMGCVVNGPGEAKEADIGIAGGKNRSNIFMHGKKVEQVDNKDALSALFKYIREIVKERR